MRGLEFDDMKAVSDAQQIIIQAIRMVVAENDMNALVGRSNKPEDFTIPSPTPDFSNRSDSNWYPACGGTETPFISRSGRKLLYCFNPSLNKHAYLNVETDVVLTDEEAREHLQTY